MARAMWKGAISFGLVNIPIGLSAATRPQDVHFHMLHDSDGGRIREKRVCELDGKEVPYEHIVKGYELTKDNYLTVTKDELKAVDPVADRTVAIEAFVKLEEVDPVFFDRSYFAQPEGRADKAYALLVAAMEKSGRVAIGRIVLSTKQHLCMIRLANGGMQLTTLLYGDELVEAPKPVKATVTKKEVDMAEALVEQLATPFEPKKFKNEYSERVHDLIAKKSKGKELKAPDAPETETISDLSEALERSLQVVKGGAARSGEAKKTAARKPARATRKAGPKRRAASSR